MKIKNRNVSFLALTLAGALSLASLEGVYAVEKEEKGAKEDKDVAAVASKKKGSEETARPKEEVSTNREELGIKSINSENKDDVAEKAKDKDGQKAKSDEKTKVKKPAITILEKKDKTIEIKNSSTGNALQIKSKEGVIEGKSISTLREIIEILPEGRLRGVTAIVIFEPGKGGEDFLKIQGFTRDNIGSIRAELRSEEIGLVMERIALARAMDRNLGEPYVKLGGLKNPEFVVISAHIKDPKFPENVWRRENAFEALISVVENWDERGYREGTMGGEFRLAGSKEGWNHRGMYLNSNIGMGVFDDFDRVRGMWEYIAENKFSPTTVLIGERESPIFIHLQSQYPDMFFQEMPNGKASAILDPDTMNTIVNDTDFDGAGMYTSFSGFREGEFEGFQNYLQASESQIGGGDMSTGMSVSGE